MAKLKPGIFSELNGSIGDVTFVMSPIGTIAKQKVPSHSKSHTYAQMRQRLQLRNIQNLCKCFKGTMLPCFEDRLPLVSNYHELIRANHGIVPVYLTKDEASANGCVAAGYQISRGALPEIKHTIGTDDLPVTDIALGGLTLGPATTVKEFSDAVCNNNDHILNSDKISCFRCTQTVNGASRVPYVSVVAEEITLDSADSDTLLYDICSPLCFGLVDGRIGAQTAVSGAICWVHSRTEEGKIRVSTQRLMPTNNPILEHYQGQGHLEEAIQSYGGASDWPKQS